MSNNKSLVNTNTIMLILHLLEDEDMYGYQMIEELEKKSNNIFSLKAGTLYPLLHDLEKKGYVKSYDNSSEGARIRKYYSITKEGKKSLFEKKNQWKEYTDAINLVMQEV